MTGFGAAGRRGVPQPRGRTELVLPDRRGAAPERAGPGGECFDGALTIEELVRVELIDDVEKERFASLGVKLIQIGR